MALVRCSCISSLDIAWREPAEGSLRQLLLVPDPDCGYVLHRLAAGEPG